MNRGNMNLIGVINHSSIYAEKYFYRNTILM